MAPRRDKVKAAELPYFQTLRRHSFIFSTHFIRRWWCGDMPEPLIGLETQETHHGQVANPLRLLTQHSVTHLHHSLLSLPATQGQFTVSNWPSHSFIFYFLEDVSPLILVFLQFRFLWSCYHSLCC